jgi:uncharacterized C2H2 Zn-finger protein
MSFTHSGAFKCEACNVNFSSKEEFEKHIKKEHSSESISNTNL